MFGQINEIKDLALKYSKPQLGRMAQLGMIEPQKAMMAGMMRDRIAKEDAKPPTSTVAQDVLGLQPPQQQQAQPQQMGMPQMAQAQGMPQQQQAPQPQMGMPPQPEQPPMDATQMAATGGLTSLPVPEQDYAGGGIVAFAGGGDTDGVAHFDSGDLVAQKHPSLLFNFGSDGAQSVGEDPAMLQQQLAQAESRLAQTPPGRGRGSLVNQVNELRARVASTAPAVQTRDITAPAPAPAAYDSKAWGDFSRQVSAQVPRVDTTAALATNEARAAADNAQPSAERPINVGGRRLPAISRPSGEIGVEKAKLENVKDIDEILNETKGIYEKQGIVDPYEGLMAKEEKKRGELGTRKDQAKGEFLMNLGVGLMGATRGQEFAALGRGAAKGMADFKDAMKDVRASEEKLDDRINAYELAKYNAKKTGTDAAIAKRDSMRDKRDAAEVEAIKARNAANVAQAQVQQQTYNTDVTSQTSRDVAGMHNAGAMAVERERQKAMPEAYKMASSEEMAKSMPGASFLERVSAYSQAVHPKDVQNAVINAVTSANKYANEEWASELLYNKPLIELKKKADAGDKTAIEQLKTKRNDLEKFHLDRVYRGNAGATTQSGDASTIPATERQQALAFIQANPNDPSVPALKASLGIR
jgi:hypothetical protein